MTSDALWYLGRGTGVMALVVPFGGAYRPMWLGLGTVAFDLLLAIVVTSLLRRRIGLRGWRAVAARFAGRNQEVLT